MLISSRKKMDIKQSQKKKKVVGIGVGDVVGVDAKNGQFSLPHTHSDHLV